MELAIVVIVIVGFLVVFMFFLMRLDERARNKRRQETALRSVSGQTEEAEADASENPARLGVAYISQRAEDHRGGKTDGEPEYAHEYITASTVRRSRFAGIGTPKEAASRYPAEEVEDHINRRASLGWTLDQYGAGLVLGANLYQRGHVYHQASSDSGMVSDV